MVQTIKQRPTDNKESKDIYKNRIFPALDESVYSLLQAFELGTINGYQLNLGLVRLGLSDQEIDEAKESFENIKVLEH